MRGFYFGTHNRPGVVHVPVDVHEINQGINQPALRPLFRFKRASFISFALCYHPSGHRDFAAYIANSKNNAAADGTSNNDGYDMVIFRRSRENGRLLSFEDVDQQASILDGIISQ